MCILDLSFIDIHCPLSQLNSWSLHDTEIDCWNLVLYLHIYDNFTDWKPKCLLHFFVLFTKLFGQQTSQTGRWIINHLLETKHLYEPVGRSVDLSVGRSVRHYFPKRWEVSLPCSYQSTCFNVPKLRFLFLMLQVEVSPTTSHFLSPIISLFPNMYYEACSKKRLYFFSQPATTKSLHSQAQFGVLSKSMNLSIYTFSK